MPAISDPADGNFNPPPKSKVDALIDYFIEHPFASNMKSGEPKLLVDEILRLRRECEYWFDQAIGQDEPRT